MSRTISVSWSTRREHNDGFVLEVHRNQQGDVLLANEYGPMPSHVVPAFVEGRRRIVAEKALQMQGTYVEEDFDWMKETPQLH